MAGLDYIKQSLGRDEELVHYAQYHWMYTVSASMNIIFSLILSIGIIYIAIYVQPLFGPAFPPEFGLFTILQLLHPGVKILSLFVFLSGVLRFAKMMIDKVTTEIAVTNKRIIYKRGLVARYVGEINIDRIEGVNVLQSVLGRIFDYGRVMIRGMGVGEVILPPIAEPIKFHKAIEVARNT